MHSFPVKSQMEARGMLAGLFFKHAQKKQSKRIALAFLSKRARLEQNYYSKSFHHRMAHLIYSLCIEDGVRKEEGGKAFMRFKESTYPQSLRIMTCITHTPVWWGSNNRVQQEYSERPTINIQVSPPNPNHSPAKRP